jgi:hypothetical protein
MEAEAWSPLALTKQAALWSGNLWPSDSRNMVVICVEGLRRMRVVSVDGVGKF